MFKELSKLEKAGLIIGSIECVAGLGMAMYAHIKLLKQYDARIQDIKDTTQQALETVNNIYNQED